LLFIDPEPIEPEPMLPLFMSGCFFIIAMHFLFFIMALSDMDWHFFIVFMSLFDIAAFAAPETPLAKAKLNIKAVNVLMEALPIGLDVRIGQCAGNLRRKRISRRPHSCSLTG
jgi:hypothetical protein